MSLPPSAPRLVFLVPANDCSQPVLAGADLEIDRNSPAFLKGWGIWSLLTGLILRRSGRFRVEFATRLQPGSDAIHVAHVDTLEACTPADDCFVVGVQGDRLRALDWVNLTVVQNQVQADAEAGRVWLPLWPQPGLEARSPGRDGARTVAYAGSFRNFALLPHAFADTCRRCGLEPRMLLDGQWHACAEVDVLVGIRSFDTRTHDHKPASKLVNAWLAGIPFIGGCDSAFSQLGEPGRDYLRVATPAEFERALVRLRTDSAAYAGFVAAGRRRAAFFDRAAVTRAWVEFIETIAMPRHARWLGRAAGALS